MAASSWSSPSKISATSPETISKITAQNPPSARPAPEPAEPDGAAGPKKLVEISARTGKPKRRKALRACGNCQRTHLTCDDNRPCERCVKRGCADSCTDGPRKKVKYIDKNTPTSQTGHTIAFPLTDLSSFYNPPHPSDPSFAALSGAGTNNPSSASHQPYSDLQSTSNMRSQLRDSVDNLFGENLVEGSSISQSSLNDSLQSRGLNHHQHHHHHPHQHQHQHQHPHHQHQHHHSNNRRNSHSNDDNSQNPVGAVSGQAQAYEGHRRGSLVANVAGHHSLLDATLSMAQGSALTQDAASISPIDVARLMSTVEQSQGDQGIASVLQGISGPGIAEPGISGSGISGSGVSGSSISAQDIAVGGGEAPIAPKPDPSAFNSHAADSEYTVVARMLENSRSSKSDKESSSGNSPTYTSNVDLRNFVNLQTTPQEQTPNPGDPEFSWLDPPPPPPAAVVVQSRQPGPAFKRFDSNSSDQSITTPLPHPSDIYRNVREPYPYTPAFRTLLAFLKQRFPREQLMRIVRSMARIRPSFIAYTKDLTHEDLVFMEQCFQRSLLEYEKYFVYSGTPTIVWRRTGQIAAVAREFCMLTQWPRHELRSRFIVEVMSDDSAIDYFERFSEMTVTDARGDIMFGCSLLTPMGQQIRTSAVLTVRKDLFGIPMTIIGNFLPHV